MRGSLRRSNSGGNLAASANDSSSSKGLASFLGSSAPKKNSKSGSATVAGDQIVASSTESEIYIRADGKKVRKVKRTVRKPRSGSGDDTVTRSSSMKSRSGSFSDAASSGTEGEVYTRADGKKVRRVKKTVSKNDLGSSMTSASSNSSPAATTDSLPSAKSSLSGFLDLQKPKGTGKISGSATVGGDKVTKEESEIITRPDGKKVRRIKKTVVRSKSSAISLAGTPPNGTDTGSKDEGEVYVNSEGKRVRRVKRAVSASAAQLSSMRDSVKSTPPPESAPTVTPSSTPASPGKPLPTEAAPQSTPEKSKKDKNLDVFMNLNSPAKNKKKSAGATVAGDTPTRSKSFGEGEIYIRPDGKKVRRVRKSNAVPSDKSSLSAMLASNAATADKKSGSATVAGDVVKKEEIGEVYIRADGKKVRRIKKTVARSSSERDLTGGAKSETPDSKGPNATSDGLGSFLGNSASGTSKRMSGSATVTGAPTSSKMADGEIYINSEGKRVRRVRRSKVDADAAASVSKSTTAAKVPAGSEKLSDSALTALLESPRSAKKKGISSATVSGESPSKSKSKQYAEGEIYIRADGKKVRRVKRSALQKDANKTSLSALMGDGKSGATNKSASATVAGDQVVKKTPDGEIIIRADGKKVLRRKKPKGDKSSAASSNEGEVYRRADGKLVRRVKRSSSNAAGDLAGFIGEKENKKDTKSGNATVAGGAISRLKDKNAKLSTLLKKEAEKEQTASSAATVQTAPLSSAENSSSKDSTIPMLKPQLSESEEATASLYRKMLALGMPKEAVRHKMTQDGADAKIIEYVVGGDGSESASVPAPVDVSASAAAPPPAPATGAKLSDDEEAIAASYRKKLNMGMPEAAVRHKMTQDGVDSKIVDAVFSADASAVESTSKSSEAAAALSTQLTDDEEALAAFYRKKLKLGMPEDAVRHKMTQDGVDEKIISAVLGGDQSTSAPSPSASQTAPASEAPSGVPLTDDEEAMARLYRKKLKLGMPEDAVRHKMVQDGVDQKIIAAVVGGDASSPSEASPTSSSQPPPTPTVQLSEEEEAIAARFRKMSKMGLPPDAVKHKMVQEGVDQKIVDAVLSGVSTAQEAPQSSAPAASNASLTKEEQYLVDSYKKKLKMGMPKQAVEHKMVQDGVDPKLVPFVMGDDAAPSPAATPVAATNGQSSSQGSVAYIVVVGDEKESKSMATADDVKSAVHADPDEKFAVKVSEAHNQKADTKFMTLDEIAKLTGQNKEELEKMAKEKGSSDGSAPRFVLQAPARQDSLYAVEVPAAPGAPAPAAAPVPAGAHMAPIRDGQEVVDSGLASAARAVSALGDGDMKSLLEKLQAGEIGALIEKLKEAEKRQKKLEKQLAQAGIGIAEDIDYSEALAKVEQIAKRMNEIGGSDVVLPDKEEQNKLREEYFKLEQEMERYNTALMMTEEYQAEQDRIEKKWEDDNFADNLEALKKIRRHMPVKIKSMSEADLCSNPSPNGKFLPKAIAKKFKRTNILQIIRINPDDIERMHPSTLENMRVTGLTLTERRALYCHLKVLGPKWEKNKAEKMTERKWTWFKMMKNNFKENLAPYTRHVEQYGPPGNHPYATRDNPNSGCPLIGKQCPIKADLVIDYNNDYGYPDGDEYEVSDVRKADADDPGAKAMQEALELAREKKANERADLLKKHYKGKLLQVSKANGSCEAMDEAMDKMENNTLKWIEFKLEKGENEAEADKKKEVANFQETLNELKLMVLDFAQRSGMQTSGKKKAGGDAADPRSLVEASLSEEVYECSQQFFTFIKDRMKEIEIRDTRVQKTIELLEGMLGELHERNIATLEKLGVKRQERSRKLKKNSDMLKEVEDKMKPKEEEKAAEEAPSGMPGPPGPGRGGGRGGLLDAIQGRGRGGRGGGRGDLLSAIAGRGRGRGGRGGGGDDGGRGGLLAAIQGRGRGGGGGDDGGRGGLMAAIQARGAGRGRGGGGGDGGRGGLLAAIQARGGGGD